MNLVPISSPVLWEPALVVDRDDIAQWRHSIKLMRELLERLNGVCLSAPQVGIPRRIFVTKYEGMHVCINPRFYPGNPGRTSRQEGSLSKPGWSAYVSRLDSILPAFMKLDGTLSDAKGLSELSGIEARVYQHACDYLEGTPLFAKPAAA